MNLLEHYIKEIYSEKDISDRFEKSIGHPPIESLIEIDATINCYGDIERKTIQMFKSDWDKAKEVGYYMG